MECAVLAIKGKHDSQNLKVKIKGVTDRQLVPARTAEEVEVRRYHLQLNMHVVHVDLLLIKSTTICI